MYWQMFNNIVAYGNMNNRKCAQWTASQGDFQNVESVNGLLLAAYDKIQQEKNALRKEMLGFQAEFYPVEDLQNTWKFTK